MSQQQPGGAGNCMDDIKRWWAQVPIGVKSIYYITIGQFIFSTLIYNIAIYLACSPHLILKFQIWRMFTTQFIDEPMGLIFGLLSITFTAINFERSIGTVSFVLDFFFKNFLIQLVNFIIVLMLCFIFNKQPVSYSVGLFNIVILYMSLRCYSDPETSTNFMCFPIQLRNKYQPIAIVLFFTLLSSQLRIDFIASILLGYIEVRFYGGMMLRLSEARINSLKNSFLFKPLSNRGDFVEPNSSFLIQTNNQSSQSSASAASNAFTGRGVTIGGASTQPAPSQNRPNQQQYVINPSQQQQQQSQQQQQQHQEGADFQQFGGKGVSIGGGPSGNTLSIQQQREAQLKRLQQQQQQQESQEHSNDNKLDMDTNADTSNDSNNPNNAAARNEQKNQQKKDGYTALNEDLL